MTIKRILLAIVIVFISITTYSVKAAEIKTADGKKIDCNAKYPKLQYMKLENFNIKVVKRKENQYEFFLNPIEEVKDVPVTISCYDITNINKGRTLVAQKAMVGHSGGFYFYPEADKIYECEAQGELKYELLNEKGEAILDATGNAAVCSTSFMQVFDEYEPADEGVINAKNCQDIANNIGIQNSTTPINCTNPSNEFEKNFCLAKSKSKAINFGNDKTFKDYNPKFSENADKNAASGKKSDESLKCDVGSKANSSTYYVNKQYLFGTGTKTEAPVKYQYHYNGPENKTEVEKNGCKINCQEAVTVEYGAPVAIKAGLCFTYKVKVTSRVSCWMETPPAKPDIYSGYCEPYPVCHHGSKVYMQGGPSEEFDACIQSCDGGKYTSKCSTKCYKKVYGTNKIKKSNNEVQNTATIKKLELPASTCLKNTEPEVRNPNCYFVNENGTIKWKCPNGFNCNDQRYEGRWYNTHWAGFAPKSHYTLCPYNDGIYRRSLGNGNVCSDSCNWEIGSCNNPYLNPDWAEYDNYKNLETYQQAVNACQAKATCTTSVAYFRISAGYSNYSDNSYTEINFPYSKLKTKEQDKLASGSSRTIDNSGSKYSTLIIGSKKNERENSGCYAPLGEVKYDNLYQAEWSFPGSWLNNKNGEISYVYKPDNENSWEKINNAYCVPLNAKNVNQKWWNWYMKATLKGQNTSISSDEYNNKCGPYETSNSITKVEKVSANDIEKWNINAITNSFGYFKWSIHIQCFYALNTNPGMVKQPNTCCTSECCGNNCNPQAPYRTRSVDLNNLFPDSTGKETASDEAGRSPGFNWSEYATNTKNNPKYISNPKEYLKRVQSIGQNIYDDKYLDYYFELNKQDLKKLKDAANSTRFTGTIKKRANQVTTYYSKIIRDLGNSKTPAETEATTCNNLKNWHEKGCDNIK